MIQPGNEIKKDSLVNHNLLIEKKNQGLTSHSDWEREKSKIKRGRGRHDYISASPPNNNCTLV